MAERCHWLPTSPDPSNGHLSKLASAISQCRYGWPQCHSPHEISLSMLSLFAILSLCSQLIMSCGGTAKNWQSSARGASLTGSVRAGQHPIIGSVIQLYVAGNANDGSPATSLLVTPVKSDSNGAFAISGDYACPNASSLLYITATGGNPGLAYGTDNAAAALMKALGPCSSLSSSQSIAINEVTTAASVVPLAPFMMSSADVGSATTDETQLRDAFTQVTQILKADGQTRSGQTSTSVDPAIVVATRTIGNILLPCLTSIGGKANDGSSCGQLFADTQLSGEPPSTETIGAALQLARSRQSTAFSSSRASAPSSESLSSLASISSIDTAPHAADASVASTVPANAVPPASIFTPPPVNACISKYDQFYEAEQGVYAYWALCESGTPLHIYDYVGQFDLTPSNHAWSSGLISGGESGPVPDDETAAMVPSGNAMIENQGIPFNTNQGTVAAWINGNAMAFPETAAWFGAVAAKSGISLSISSAAPPRTLTCTNGVCTSGTTTCFNGSFTNSLGTVFTAQSCGSSANVWHRVAFTWKSGTLRLYVDGVSAASTAYTGALDNNVFYYRLFTNCCNNGLPLKMAKVLVANRSWSASEIAEDYTPGLPDVPVGGVYISTTKLGAIHRDVLGYADYNQDISTPSLQSALISGLTTAGFTAVRYSGGRGFKMDLENWRAPMTCATTPGSIPNVNLSAPIMANTIDTYLPQIAKPMGLDVVYTVNYGSNPPFCNAGGDPVANGANLVQYANQTKSYAIKHWEIGNEVFTNHTTDFHPNPNTGASYASYEPAYYNTMKGKDPTIKIGVPVGLTSYADQSVFDLPVMAHASYDAVIWHNYPMKDPITDGATVYQDRVTSNMVRTHGALLLLETELMNNGKSPDSIWITEWSAAVSGNLWSKQTVGAVMPIFAAVQLAEYMQAGVQLANLWAEGGTEVCSTFNYDGDGDTAYNWWECGMGAPVYTGQQGGVGEVLVGLKPGDLTPVARAFQLFSQSGFVTEGEHMVHTQADVQNAPWLLSYAATHGSSYAVLLINRDRDNAHTVPVSIRGWTSGQAAQQWTYGRAQYDNSKSGNWSVGPVTTSYGPWTGKFQAQLPPWSVNVIMFTK